MNFKAVRKSSKPILSCPMHAHRTWEVIYQLDAPTVAVVAKEEYRVMAGELIVIPPNMPHRTVSEIPFRDFCIQLEHMDFPPHPTVVRDADGVILEIYELIRRLWDDRGEENHALLEKLSEALCLAVKKASAVVNEPSYVLRFKAILRENIENADFDLNAAIRKMGYHPDYFRRCFRRYTSVAPLTFLNRMRIERAKNLLETEGSLSVGEIAARCGFRDALYFSTAFHRAVGCAPLAYRKAYM